MMTVLHLPPLPEKDQKVTVLKPGSWDLAVSGYHFLADNRLSFVRLSALPAALSYVGHRLDFWFGFTELPFTWVGPILDYLAMVIFTVAWMRLNLYGKDLRPMRAEFDIGGREVRFAAAFLMIALLPLSLVGVLFQAFEISWFSLFFAFGATAVVIYLFMRLSLALPAEAAGLGQTIVSRLAFSWMISERHVKALIGGSVLAVLPSLLAWPGTAAMLAYMMKHNGIEDPFVREMAIIFLTYVALAALAVVFCDVMRYASAWRRYRPAVQDEAVERRALERSFDDDNDFF